MYQSFYNEKISWKNITTTIINKKFKKEEKHKGKIPLVMVCIWKSTITNVVRGNFEKLSSDKNCILFIYIYYEFFTTNVKFSLKKYLGIFYKI